jgi:hypothetical protein
VLRRTRGSTMRTDIDCGFGVSIETINSDSAKIHNLKSNNKNIINLGVREL